MSDEPQTSRRKARPGSARWRQQQRKERQIRQQQQRTGHTPAPQVNPAGGFEMPDIKLPMGTLRVIAYIATAALLVVGMIATLRLFNPPEPVALPNALWMGTEWTYDMPSDQDVSALVERLRANRIGTAYVWVTYMKPDLAWSGKTADRDDITGEVVNTINPLTGEEYRNELAEMEPNIISFVEQYKEAYPEGKLFGWISFPANAVPLDDTTLHTRVAELSTLLVTTYGFDGVYLNIEPVRDGDEDFLQLLRTVRLALDDTADSMGLETRIPIAVAIPPDWRPSDPTIPFSPRITSVFEWSTEYKQNVALLVDEMLIMAYNSGLSRQEDYSTWVAYQTKAYAQAVAELDVETEVLIGVPTYPDEPPGHDDDIENIPTAVQGVRSGLVQAGDAAEVVRGLTIYVEWTTDETEWATFQQEWVNPPPQ